ncbi:hypothetical protein TNCV_3973561 [Trichonephila clavipes]|nr:hypothetical protein TNCV_3973561 [Trichonephila clavipes]
MMGRSKNGLNDLAERSSGRETSISATFVLEAGFPRESANAVLILRYVNIHGNFRYSLFKKLIVLVFKDIQIAHPVERLVTLIAIPLGLGSNPGEGMDVCKSIVPSGHGGILNRRRAASPLVRLLEREERWKASSHIRVEPSQIVMLPA